MCHFLVTFEYASPGKMKRCWLKASSVSPVSFIRSRMSRIETASRRSRCNLPQMKARRTFGEVVEIRLARCLHQVRSTRSHRIVPAPEIATCVCFIELVALILHNIDRMSYLCSISSYSVSTCCKYNQRRFSHDAADALISQNSEAHCRPGIPQANDHDRSFIS